MIKHRIAKQSVFPPTAPVRPKEIQSPHGTRMDNYAWLRDDDRKNSEVLAYLNGENEYKDSVMAPLKQKEEQLFREIIGRIKQDDGSVPYRFRNNYYYHRYEAQQEYPIYARKKDSLQANEEILLDVNGLATGHKFFRVGAMELSPNGCLLAWAEDQVGRNQYTIKFKEIATNRLLRDQINNCEASMAWADDNRSFFYIEKDPVTLLGTRVKKHVLGTEQTDDQLVYEETDHSFYLHLDRTGDEQYIMLQISSTLVDELRFIPVHQPGAEFKVLQARLANHKYDADHIDQKWIIRSNHKAKNFRLMEVADHAVGSMLRWNEVIAHRSEVLLCDFTLFNNYVVVEEQTQAVRQIRVRSWTMPDEFVIATDEPAYTASIEVNAEQDSSWLRYSYTSLVTPASICEINMRTQQKRVLKQDTVLGGFDPKKYISKRVWAPARDGKKIPISLLYRHDLVREEAAPLYQYAYGAYGISSDPEFCSHVLSLVDRGIVYAIAHVRGGQEMGREWYESGKLLKKKNSFNDFVDASEFLINEGYTAATELVAMGGSAGGLLVGAVANMRPDLYHTVVAHVPFVDVVTTMLDESIPLTSNEMDEWGDPKKKVYYEYMLSYSPYDNVKRQKYPHMLVTTGLWDSQVQYFEPAKWVAKLRATKSDSNVLLFHTNMDAGHGGNSGRFRRYREYAMEYAFVLHQLGLLDA